ncbi:hypothetical protein N7491_006156 [Penicillium cf. griseofulvum]|uniref:Protein kinase domain-containing protein n=1 Tax=Penicillium cf. griseofulvum TaxID=2972120 RepID=A0A9W9IX80_9EURO|nr:hypothetical protein N7472_010813 [Penicillium cf. griseofulvum]KAJ5429140.1 hypothetical protein N7491_006156 [Penicillium cf. griseofulvum]
MAAPPFDNPQLDILEMNETFEDINGIFGFAGTLVVYRMNGELYHGILKARYYPSTIVNPADLTDIIQIPSSAYSPLYTPELTRAQDPPTKDIHVKRPRLIGYDRLCKSPHPNATAESILAEAKVSGDRIRGLCFTKYSHTLMKRKSRSMRKTSKDYSGALVGVESGIRRLHSLGLVHNDINPSNIMFDGDELVIIDFGSCRSIGESKGFGTYEWYDEKVQLSLPENDLNGLKEIRIWLGDDLAFQFEA